MIKTENLGCNIFVNSGSEGYDEWNLLPKEGQKFYPISYEIHDNQYLLQETREGYLPFFTLVRIRNLFLAVLCTIVSLGFALAHPVVRHWFTGRQVVRIVCSSEEIKRQAQEYFRTRLNEHGCGLGQKARTELLNLFNQNRALNAQEQDLVNQYAVAFARLAPEETQLRKELLDLLLSDLFFQMHEVERLKAFGPQPAIQAQEDVHSRDLVSKRAIEILRRRHGGDLSPLLTTFLVDQCVLFLRAFPDAIIRKTALDAALKPGVDGFSAFLNDEKFSLPQCNHEYPKIMCTGAEILARLWVFTQIYFDPVNLQWGQKLAEEGIATGLASAIEDGWRVCQPGKTGRLVTAVLQGRLNGITSDATDLTPDAATDLFFNDPNKTAEGGETKGDQRRKLFNQITENQKREELMRDLDAWLIENPVNNSEQVKMIITKLIDDEIALCG